MDYQYIFKPYHLHFLWQSSEHVGAILKIR